MTTKTTITTQKLSQVVTVLILAVNRGEVWLSQEEGFEKQIIILVGIKIFGMTFR